MPWDGNNPYAVGHEDVLALSRYVEANLVRALSRPGDEGFPVSSARARPGSPLPLNSAHRPVGGRLRGIRELHLACSPRPPLQWHLATSNLADRGKRRCTLLRLASTQLDTSCSDCSIPQDSTVAVSQSENARMEGGAMLLNPPARPASDLSPTAGLSFWSSGCVRNFPVGTQSRFAIARYREHGFRPFPRTCANSPSRWRFQRSPRRHPRRSGRDRAHLL